MVSSCFQTVVSSETATLAVEVGSESRPELNVSFLEEASKLDTKLEKLNIYSRHQPVIFPDHLQVPENYKNGLIFGSFDANFEESGENVNCPDDGKASTPATESLKGNDELSRESSMSSPIASSTAQEGDDYLGNPHYLPVMPDNSKPLNDLTSCSAAMEYDQLKQLIVGPQVGPQHPFVHTAPNYGFPFIRPMLGNQLVQCEGLEIQGGNSLVSSTSASMSAAQHADVGQSSVAASPPPFPIFQQLYPPNYFPFSPYFPPFFLASNAQQFFGQSGFPHRPSTNNIHLAPSTAVPGIQFTVPQSNAGLNAGNPAQFAIPFGYGSYNPRLAVTFGSSAGNEDRLDSTASELQNKVYATDQVFLIPHPTLLHN
ncbi:hypothetical protein U1Q18_000265 [Sarracenia purpurea var. burkii]